jgi:hypothetical protein
MKNTTVRLPRRSRDLCERCGRSYEADDEGYISHAGPVCSHCAAECIEGDTELEIEWGERCPVCRQEWAHPGNCADPKHVVRDVMER